MDLKQKGFSLLTNVYLIYSFAVWDVSTVVRHPSFLSLLPLNSILYSPDL